MYEMSEDMMPSSSNGEPSLNDKLTDPSPSILKSAISSRLIQCWLYKAVRRIMNILLPFSQRVVLTMCRPIFEITKYKAIICLG